MTVKPHNIPATQKILVIGAGRGGTAMLELFCNDPLINIVGIFDADQQAPALAIARERGIPIFAELAQAIEVSSPSLVFNLTGDDSAADHAALKLGRENIVSGFQAFFIWGLLTRLKQTNEQVTYLAHHDSLTELPNRILFYDRLNQAITRAHRNKESIAVLFIDLDGFKLINDKFGHDVGDSLLREAARRIEACVRESDTVARMGGDEFTVILCNVLTSTINIRVAENIVESIARPFILNGKNCSVSVSIGISLYPENGETAERLVKIADAAMYLAKQSGKNCYRFIGN